jgi:hypothetical protein
MAFLRDGLPTSQILANSGLENSSSAVFYSLLKSLSSERAGDSFNAKKSAPKEQRWTMAARASCKIPDLSTCKCGIRNIKNRDTKTNSNVNGPHSMKLTLPDQLKQFVPGMQGCLFPKLEEALGPLTDTLRQLIAVLELVQVEAMVGPWHGGLSMCGPRATRRRSLWTFWTSTSRQ